MSRRENHFFQTIWFWVLKLLCVQAQYDISVRFHSLSYNLKSRGYSPTVLLDFSIQLEMPFITKGSAKSFDCYKLWEGLFD